MMETRPIFMHFRFPSNSESAKSSCFVRTPSGKPLRTFPGHASRDPKHIWSPFYSTLAQHLTPARFKALQALRAEP